MADGYSLVQDEAFTYLDARGNPVTGRKLTFRLEDGTVVDIDVNKQDYRSPDRVKALVEAEISAHDAIAAL